MAMLIIIAARALQILGHEGTVEPGTELATIETDCDLGGLLSHLQFGAAVVKPEETNEGDDEGDEGSASDPLHDAIVAAIQLEIEPPLTNKQVVERLAADGIKTTTQKVAAVRKTLPS